MNEWDLSMILPVFFFFRVLLFILKQLDAYSCLSSNSEIEIGERKNNDIPYDIARKMRWRDDILKKCAWSAEHECSFIHLKIWVDEHWNKLIFRSFALDFDRQLLRLAIMNSNTLIFVFLLFFFRLRLFLAISHGVVLRFPVFFFFFFHLTTNSKYRHTICRNSETRNRIRIVL